jgi:hypothetical protein
MLKSLNYMTLGEALDLLQKTLPPKNKSDTYYKIDVDPANLW